MTEREDKLRTTIIEAILAYLEGKKSFRSVLVLGVTAQSKSNNFTSKILKEVVEKLSLMGNQVGNNEKFSKEQIQLTFTELLEMLMKDGYI